MMTATSTSTHRLYFTFSVAGFVALLLAGEAINGGVVTHHLMASADMPGISNWWGLVTLPVLAWLLFPASESGSEKESENEIVEPSKGWFGFSKAVWKRFAAAIAYGGIMAVGFELGYDQVTGNMLMILFPVGIFYPLYRGELVVGFVMGMTYTFGGIIPIGAAAIVGLASLMLHWVARFVMRKVKGVA